MYTTGDARGGQSQLSFLVSMNTKYKIIKISIMVMLEGAEVNWALLVLMFELILCSCFVKVFSGQFCELTKPIRAQTEKDDLKEFHRCFAELTPHNDSN